MKRKYSKFKIGLNKKTQIWMNKKKINYKIMQAANRVQL